MHPYRGLPSQNYWRSAVPLAPVADLDPVSKPRFRITPDDTVATLGSCFAQHVARHLVASGFAYLLAEPPEPVADGSEEGSEPLFSARYGNVYTVRQAKQLLDRAFDGWVPGEGAWERDGRWFDPFRPTAVPGGFASRQLLEDGLQIHLAAVRQVFTCSDLVVFTLGLTEAWRSRIDGAVFPTAPGVAAGHFDPARHEFVNFGVSDVVTDLAAWCDRLRALNPRVRVLLTVSPVPLAATYEDRHVLASTTYSKSVLRVAVDEVTASRPWVDYFPSFEIITAPSVRGRYYEADGRSVSEAGVAHVMRVFFANYTRRSGEEPARADTTATRVAGEYEKSRVICDEDLIVDAETRESR